jgi:hypothetical protein
MAEHMSVEELREELTVQNVILESLLTIEGCEDEREEARQEIKKIKRLLDRAQKVSHGTATQSESRHQSNSPFEDDGGGTSDSACTP